MGLPWNDPAYRIAWPVNAPLLSERDQNHPRFSQFQTPFVADIEW
jgi:dTDP-4-dehydrorhamnose 3,5-epimerase